MSHSLSGSPPGVLDRVSLAAPEISPFVDGVKRLMQDIDAVCGQ